MSAPRWIDRLRGLIQREESATPPTVASTSPDIPPPPATELAVVTPASRSVTPAAQITPPLRPSRPYSPPVKVIDSRAFAEAGLRQVATTGDRFVQYVSKRGLKVTPGLDHDLALMIMSYSLVVVSLTGRHGEKAAEAHRILRTNLKGALLSVLRKHYLKSQTDELKLGANMVTFVDELLAGADVQAQGIEAAVRAGKPAPFEPLYAQLVAPFGGEGLDAHASYAPFLSEQFARVAQALENPPYQ